jgi:hypothetical protein
MLLVAGAASLLSMSASAITVYALTESGSLGRFDSTTPNEYVNLGQVAGLGEDETLIGMDFRPADGILYAVSDGNNLYSIDKQVATATLVGAITPAIGGSRFGFDFNPVVDRLRVTNDGDDNLRCDPGTLACLTDTSLAFGSGDVNAGRNPNVVGSAYTNSAAGATQTTLYAIDSNLNALLRQDPANDGTLATVGSLGVNTTDLVGFDIVTVGTQNLAWASLTGNHVLSRFFSIDLTTGLASPVGGDDRTSLIGAGDQVRALAIDASTASAPIPLPAAGWLALSGVAAALTRARRRKSRL